MYLLKKYSGMKLLGLIGYPLGHSFSKKYFADKFEQQGIKDFTYENFPIPQICNFPELVDNYNNLLGLNVTIPYKQQVLEYVDEQSATVSEINAANTIKIIRETGQKPYLKAFNTDTYGFEKSLHPLLKPHHTKSLILGTGGASKAIAWVFDKLNISYAFVSRNPANSSQLSYQQLNDDIISENTIIVNTSPLGMYPNINNAPDIPYASLSEKHILYDLVYNPEETLFMKKGKKQGSQTKNGLEMLQLQAERSWQIWNS
jgi:shikimate dehydrogenase